MAKSKKVLIAMPIELLNELDLIVKHEHRETRCAVIREAVRKYVERFKRVQGEIASASTITQAEIPLLAHEIT